MTEMSQKSRHSFVNPELNRSSFRDYLNAVSSLPVLCTLVWYFTVEMRCLATFQQYQSWLRFKTQEEDQIKFYTELYSLISLSEAILDPVVGYFIDEISSRLGLKSDGQKDYRVVFIECRILRKKFSFRVKKVISTSRQHREGR